MALASHCMVADGDYIVEANMMYGVRRVPLAEAMKGCTEVGRITYQVPNAEAGLEWVRQQVGKGYDWKGAFGLALSPNRDWQEDDRWDCFELGAATIHKAGRIIFKDTGHVSGNMLMAIHPEAA
jgi:uncharacterized protein YycO